MPRLWHDGGMRLRIDLAYDGTDFHGWATQPGLRTVQGELERALALAMHIRATPSGIAPSAADSWPRVVVAGRTDTGVHASHQVCHLDVPEDVLRRAVGHMDALPTEALRRRISHILPPDIAVHAIVEAPEGFDARFSALERVYVYRVSDGARLCDPRLRGFVLRCDDDLDVTAMNEAARCAIGLHDFGSFATPNPGGTTIREVKSVLWARAGTGTLPNPDGDGAHDVPFCESGLLTFTIVADAFAHNMVRSLVNACLQVGRGRKSVEWFRGKIANPVREGGTGPAPACGLTLERVVYPADADLASRAASIRARRTLE